MKYDKQPKEIHVNTDNESDADIIKYRNDESEDETIISNENK